VEVRLEMSLFEYNHLIDVMVCVKKP